MSSIRSQLAGLGTSTGATSAVDSGAEGATLSGCGARC